jgi:prepilin-type N-terminal cleavage/methylation domain-containing protein/prepilin-type processing-associated H-X9-DG protein
MRKNGFTLVELLVVISIIGILAAALTSQVTKVRESAQAMKCKANLRNLAQAALTYAGDSHGSGSGRHQPSESMPWAGSYEAAWATIANGRYVMTYHECPGWVGWTGAGRWTSRDMQTSGQQKACFFGDQSLELDRDPAYLSITNGVLWTYVGKDLAVYACDVHRLVAKQAAGKNRVLRSYVMNGYFGFDHRVSPTPRNMPDGRTIRLDSLSARGSAGNLLLFAELPAFRGSSHARSVATDQYSADGVLETVIRGYATTKTEVLGFNHRVAKRYVAHVAFADGHVDVLIEPQGASDNDLKELAKVLCNGDEIDQTLRDKMR